MEEDRKLHNTIELFKNRHVNIRRGQAEELLRREPSTLVRHAEVVLTTLRKALHDSDEGIKMKALQTLRKLLKPEGGALHNQCDEMAFAELYGAVEELIWLQSKQVSREAHQLLKVLQG